MWRGPRWSQREGGPLAHAAGATVVRKRWRPSVSAANPHLLRF